MPAKAKFQYQIKANKDTKVLGIDNQKISKLAFMLGAPKDKTAGLILKKKIGEQANEGEIIYEIFTNSELKLKYAKTYLEDNVIYNLR
jgi:thymidine phosphorylase